MEHPERSLDYACLTSLAWKAICEELKLDGDKWTIRVVSENGDYKVEWENDGDGFEEVTLYADGIWSTYINGQNKEGKLPPLHYKIWIQKLIANKVDPRIAYFAVEFFKELKSK